jgi:hypothetical protein
MYKIIVVVPSPIYITVQPVNELQVNVLAFVVVVIEHCALAIPEKANNSNTMIKTPCLCNNVFMTICVLLS